MLFQKIFSVVAVCFFLFTGSALADMVDLEYDYAINESFPDSQMPTGWQGAWTIEENSAITDPYKLCTIAQQDGATFASDYLTTRPVSFGDYCSCAGNGYTYQPDVYFQFAFSTDRISSFNELVLEGKNAEASLADWRNIGTMKLAYYGCYQNKCKISFGGNCCPEFPLEDQTDDTLIFRWRFISNAETEFCMDEIQLAYSSGWVSIDDDYWDDDDWDDDDWDDDDWDDDDWDDDHPADDDMVDNIGDNSDDDSETETNDDDDDDNNDGCGC